MSKNFGIPYRDRNFNIFPNTTISDIWFNDCSSSVTGKCENTKSLRDCISLCKEEICDSGYFIETPDNNNICIPFFNDSIHKRPNIYKRLHHQDIYPQLRNVKSFVFANNNILKYPPDKPNNVLYTDRIYLTNIFSNKSIGINGDNKSILDDILTNIPITLQLLPKDIERTNVSRHYEVKNGDNVIVNVPNTTYVLQTENFKLTWAMRLTTFSDPKNIFTI